MNKTIVSTPDAPKAIGPYSQAVKSQGFLFASGQIPIDPATGTIIDGDIQERTHRIMNNITAIAKEAGVDLNAIVKTTIFLTDLADFGAVNEVYGSYFQQDPPARSTVQVAALPLGSNIEIEAIFTLN